MTITPYGSWPSPLTPAVLLAGARGLSFPRVHNGQVYWMETRPEEKGRCTVCTVGPTGARALVPAPFNVRSRIHEYGGRAFAVLGTTLYFVNFSDQRVYAQPLSGDAAPVPLTPNDGRRWGECVPDSLGRGLWLVGEQDQPEGTENFLALLPLRDKEAQAPEVVASGHDFYATPCPSPDGRSLAFLAWDQGDMPWDGARLYRQPLTDAGHAHGEPEGLAGGNGTSVFQPGWSPDGTLVFVHDPEGWWNLFELPPEAPAPRPLCPRAAEFGLPLWQLGMESWCWIDDHRLACLWFEAGQQHLGVLDRRTGDLLPVPAAFDHFDGLASDGTRLVTVAAAANAFPALVALNLEGSAEVLRSSSDLPAPEGALATPEPLTFPTRDGAVAHGYFYSPKNDAVQAPTAPPPLLVISHGGPTAATHPVLNLKVQFWTSRGFAVLDVNYRGSTGYGRAYRDALQGQWGARDVEDCVDGAEALAQAGKVDGDRMAIRGSSAGGLTVLGALAFHDCFRAGTSLYGVTDLEALATETHKFEARYLDRLVGPLPEAKARYQARSPRHHAAGISAPVLFLQGLEDKIVPPSQPEAMIAAMTEAQVPSAYLTFPGEQHGFRQAETLRTALLAELSFYGRVFGFTPADATPALTFACEERLPTP
jgi:dipeptidyl aminopeptidase/acylaminoacyl peptidase